jgi:hypothetical protein
VVKITSQALRSRVSSTLHQSRRHKLDTRAARSHLALTTVKRNSSCCGRLFELRAPQGSRDTHQCCDAVMIQGTARSGQRHTEAICPLETLHSTHMRMRAVRTVWVQSTAVQKKLKKVKSRNFCTVVARMPRSAPSPRTSSWQRRSQCMLVGHLRWCEAEAFHLLAPSLFC